MNRTICKIAVASLMCLLVGACGSKTVTEYHEGSRDNVIDGTSMLVSIEENLPPIHSLAAPIMAGDTLIILDYRSTGMMCTAYDIYNDSTIGRFGKFGAGPGEIGNPLFRFYNKYNKNLYIGNGNRGKLSYFYLPEAVSDSTYDVIDGVQIDFYKGILDPYAIDESNILCTTYSDLSSRASRISRLNLVTGEISEFDSVPPGEIVHACIDVSEKDNLIFSADKKCDMLRILDLDGKVQKIIYGPDYDGDINEDDYFFSAVEICGKQVALLYTGRNSEKYDTNIILTDLDGKYIKTLIFEDTIYDMSYHDKTGRLYLTSKGEPQIGYIELDKIPD